MENKPLELTDDKFEEYRKLLIQKIDEALANDKSGTFTAQTILYLLKSKTL